MNKVEYLSVLKESLNVKNYEIRKSNIHGYGVFSKRKFKKNDFIHIHFDKLDNTGNFQKDYKITNFGSFLNHSNNPNAETRIENGIYKSYALKNINIGDEIIIDYTNRPELEQPINGWK